MLSYEQVFESPKPKSAKNPRVYRTPTCAAVAQYGTPSFLKPWHVESYDFWQTLHAENNYHDDLEERTHETVALSQS